MSASPADQRSRDTERVRWQRVRRVMAPEHVARLAVPGPVLAVERGDRVTLLAKLPPDARASVGRDATTDLPLPDDPAVSRLHATFIRVGGLVVLEDSGLSSNGTYVNGALVGARTLLKHGDRVRLGETTLLVVLPPAEAVASTVKLGRKPARPVDTPFTVAERGLLAELARPRADGRVPTNPEIAVALDRTIDTVKSHLSSVRKKLRAAGVRELDREEIARLVREDRLPSPPA